jgi:excisionase family DNA binding protein
MATEANPNLPTVLRIAEAARELGISVRSVRRLISAGELPFICLTTRRLGVLRTDVVGYIARKRVVVQQPGSGYATSIPGAVPTSLNFEKARRAYLAMCAEPRRKRTK